MYDIVAGPQADCFVLHFFVADGEHVVDLEKLCIADFFVHRFACIVDIADKSCFFNFLA